VNSRADVVHRAKLDHVICLRAGPTQSCSRRDFTNRPFCTFLHGLGHFGTFGATVEIVINLPENNVSKARLYRSLMGEGPGRLHVLLQTHCLAAA
jgi:hypothetical protein